MFNDNTAIQLRALTTLIEDRNKLLNKWETLCCAIEEGADTIVRVERKSTMASPDIIMHIESKTIAQMVCDHLKKDLDLIDNIIRDKIKFIVERDPDLIKYFNLTEATEE